MSGCAGAAPTPKIVYVTQAPTPIVIYVTPAPTPTSMVAPTPTPTPTPKPAPKPTPKPTPKPAPKPVPVTCISEAKYDALVAAANQFVNAAADATATSHQEAAADYKKAAAELTAMGDLLRVKSQSIANHAYREADAFKTVASDLAAEDLSGALDWLYVANSENEAILAPDSWFC